jgi:hypothetical protein
MSQQPFGDTQPLGSGGGHDGGDYLEIGGRPRRPGRPGGTRYLMSIAAVGLVALLGGAGVAYAVSGGGSSPSTTAAHPAASPSANPVNPAHPVHPKCANTSGPCRALRFRPFLGRIPFGFGFGIGVGAGLGLPGGLVHGQVVVSKPGGGYETVDIQSGKVTAVSSASITLKSADGYTASYSVASSTIVDAQRDGIGSVKTGNEVSLVATVTGSKATASSITDLSLFAAGRNHAFPFGAPGATPGGSAGGSAGGGSTR